MIQSFRRRCSTSTRARVKWLARRGLLRDADDSNEAPSRVQHVRDAVADDVGVEQAAGGPFGRRSPVHRRRRERLVRGRNAGNSNPTHATLTPLRAPRRSGPSVRRRGSAGTGRGRARSVRRRRRAACTPPPAMPRRLGATRSTRPSLTRRRRSRRRTRQKLGRRVREVGRRRGMATVFSGGALRRPRRAAPGWLRPRRQAPA